MHEFEGPAALVHARGDFTEAYLLPAVQPRLGGNLDMTLEANFAAAQKQQLPFHAPVGVRVAPHSAFALAVGQAKAEWVDQLEFIEAKQNMVMPFRYVFQSVRRAEPTLNKTILGRSEEHTSELQSPC